MSSQTKEKYNRSASLRKVAHQVLSKEECQTFKAALRAFRETTTPDQLIDSLEKILDSPKKLNLLREIALLLPMERRKEFIERSKRKFKGAELLLQEEYIANEAAVRSRQKSRSESMCSAGYPIAGPAVKKHSTFSGKRLSSSFLGLPDAGLRKLQQASGAYEKITLADSAPIRRLKDDSAPKVIKLNSATFQVRYKSQLLLNQVSEKSQQEPKFQSLGPVRPHVPIPTIKEESPTDDALQIREQKRSTPDEDLMERIKNQVIKPRASLSQLQDKGFWALNSPRRELQEQRRKERNLLQESADKLIEEQVNSNSASTQQHQHEKLHQSLLSHEVMIHEEQSPVQEQNKDILREHSPASQQLEQKHHLDQQQQPAENQVPEKTFEKGQNQKEDLQSHREDDSFLPSNDPCLQPISENSIHNYEKTAQKERRTSTSKKKRLSFDNRCKDSHLESEYAAENSKEASQEKQDQVGISHQNSEGERQHVLEERENLCEKSAETEEKEEYAKNSDNIDIISMEKDEKQPNYETKIFSENDEKKQKKKSDDIQCELNPLEPPISTNLTSIDNSLEFQVKQQQERLQQQLQQQQQALQLAEEEKDLEQRQQQSCLQPQQTLIRENSGSVTSSADGASAEAQPQLQRLASSPPQRDRNHYAETDESNRRHLTAARLSASMEEFSLADEECKHLVQKSNSLQRANESEAASESFSSAADHQLYRMLYGPTLGDEDQQSISSSVLEGEFLKARPSLPDWAVEATKRVTASVQTIKEARDLGLQVELGVSPSKNANNQATQCRLQNAACDSATSPIDVPPPSQSVVETQTSPIEEQNAPSDLSFQPLSISSACDVSPQEQRRQENEEHEVARRVVYDEDQEQKVMVDQADTLADDQSASQEDLKEPINAGEKQHGSKGIELAFNRSEVQLLQEDKVEQQHQTFENSDSTNSPSFSSEVPKTKPSETQKSMNDQAASNSPLFSNFIQQLPFNFPFSPQQQPQQQFPFSASHQTSNFMLQWLMMQQAAAAAAAAAVASPQSLGSSQPLEFLQQLYSQQQHLHFQQQQPNETRPELLKVTLVKSSGTFGLSIMSRRENDRCVVLVSSVATGSPAYQQGIQAGDEIVELENENVANMTLQQLGMAIRSQSTINLAIRSRNR